jgi:hypothetical protein
MESPLGPTVVRPRVRTARSYQGASEAISFISPTPISLVGASVSGSLGRSTGQTMPIIESSSSVAACSGTSSG